MIVDGKYVGGELELFKDATNWKSYVAKHLGPFVKGDVLEVGAGIGVNASYLAKNAQSYTFLEPDAELAGQINDLNKDLSVSKAVIVGTSEDLSQDASYDTIIYYDVLEHIEQSNEELRRISKHLKPGGNILIVVPAYPSLYNEFDKAVGHFRRYNRLLMKADFEGIEDLDIHKMFYLDSLGVVASWVNKWFLKQSVPSLKQVHFWDRVIVSFSKILDPIVGKSFGKSLLCVGERGERREERGER
ncbi:MAG: class I SAM-dependent methyltransferase [Bacteroidota bacterium]